MTLDVKFVYYRSFRFDGKLHIRCIGNDVSKVKRIRYVLEKQGPTGHAQLASTSVKSQAQTGVLSDYGCPATFQTDGTAGTYIITPQVMLTDDGALALGLPNDRPFIQEMAPLALEVKEGEQQRGILDKVPLPGSSVRRKRSVEALDAPEIHDPYGDNQQTFPTVEAGRRYPPLMLKFTDNGFDRFNSDLEPESGSVLARYWPNLKQVIELRAFLSPQERLDDSLQVLRPYYALDQPDSMLNDTYLALLKSLAALEYVESINVIAPEADSAYLLFGAAAVLATLITGAAVVAGNRAQDEAQPTPDFEAKQTYLNEPNSVTKGLNIRNAWDKQVTGKGARVHFSDGGLFVNHEDLRGDPNLKIVELIPNNNPKHGTASVGILQAAQNGVGVTGICHDCELYLYSNRATDELGYSKTVKDLLKHVRPGDIVGINRQTANVDVLATFLPTVHDQVWWDTIKTLTQRGAVVVCAASNGSIGSDAARGTVAGRGVDLSQWRYFNDRGDADAIVVGASRSYDGTVHEYSNYNYRYRMLNAWGDGVATLSYGNLQDKDGDDRDYTDNYGGTSSATPMVTGALSLIQSYAMEHHHVYLDANQMHLLVMASGYKDATFPHEDRLPMGARPNVHGALVMLDSILGGGRFAPPRDEL